MVPQRSCVIVSLNSKSPEVKANYIVMSLNFSKCSTCLKFVSYRLSLIVLTECTNECVQIAG